VDGLELTRSYAFLEVGNPIGGKLLVGGRAGERLAIESEDAVNAFLAMIMIVIDQTAVSVLYAADTKDVGGSLGDLNMVHEASPS
jgi:hypothetical protein